MRVEQAHVHASPAARAAPGHPHRLSELLRASPVCRPTLAAHTQGSVKLADFGFARPQAPGGANLSPYVATRHAPHTALIAHHEALHPGPRTSRAVTPLGHKPVRRWYRAPELLVGDVYGPGVDVWALGCLLVELSTGKPLFPGKSDADQLWLILRCVGCSPRQLGRMQSHPALKAVQMPKEEDMVSLEKR